MKTPLLHFNKPGDLLCSVCDREINLKQLSINWLTIGPIITCLGFVHHDCPIPSYVPENLWKPLDGSYSDVIQVRAFFRRNGNNFAELDDRAKLFRVIEVVLQTPNFPFRKGGEVPA